MYHSVCYNELHHTIVLPHDIDIDIASQYRHHITTSALDCTTIMAELNSHDFLTPDLLLAIGIEITEYMLFFYNKTPM
ncbi:hypothetical protein BDZ91DRAFT_742998 [Kalaharituber pfeilii]|nr:hypothetical protein BDZ91DRAFT_742998 [Kalaharituber pfeilii]